MSQSRRGAKKSSVLSRVEACRSSDLQHHPIQDSTALQLRSILQPHFGTLPISFLGKETPWRLHIPVLSSGHLVCRVWRPAFLSASHILPSRAPCHISTPPFVRHQKVSSRNLSNRELDKGGAWTMVAVTSGAMDRSFVVSAMTP